MAILFRNSKDTVVTEFLPTSVIKACMFRIVNIRHHRLLLDYIFFCESWCGSKARTTVGDALTFVWQGCEFWNTFWRCQSWYNSGCDVTKMRMRFGFFPNIMSDIYNNVWGMFALCARWANWKWYNIWIFNAWCFVMRIQNSLSNKAFDNGVIMVKVHIYGVGC